jgi:uncharacterized protein (DUF1778 family)
MIGPRRRHRVPGRAPRKVEIRLTEQEHALIAWAAARRPGRPLSIARFVAEAALQAAATTPSPRPGGMPSRAALAEVMAAVTAVNRIGNNLNQLAREKNAIGLRLADGDRRSSDAEWSQAARDVVDRTGFAPADDPGACRWVAVRHADDHIHIVVVLARQSPT